MEYGSCNISGKRTAQLIAVFTLLLALFGSGCNVKTPELSPEDRRNIRNFSYAGMSSETKLTASDAADGDYFGNSVSIDGDTVVIGAVLNDDVVIRSGCAYIFRYNGAGWIEEQKLTASDATEWDHFGHSVSIDGDTVVIGAPGFDVSIAGESGSAYIFRYNGTAWVEEQKLKASDAAADDLFGISVSIDGDTVVVGADRIGSGSAYIFRYDGTTSTWVEEQKLTASDAAGGDQFGESVSIDGDTVLVGAKWDDDDGDWSGSAYIFRYDGTTSTWIEEQKLTASDAAEDDQFSNSVSIDGDTVVVGAAHNDDAGFRSGSAYIFRYDGTTSTWVEEQKLTASDAAENDVFGHSVSIDGDTVVVGASEDFDAGFRSGSAYIFRYDGTTSTWVEEQKLTASDAADLDSFGSSVSIDGDTVVVGAVQNRRTGDYSGTAYIYTLISIWYVSKNGSDSNDGTSWSDAFSTIEKALEVAARNNEIWVETGTYLLWSPLVVDEAVGIFGGFDGTETQRDLRDWRNNVTTVDGQNSVYHCFHVSADATIDGFTITGGNADGTSVDGSGGGIYNSASATISNCIFVDNSAVWGGAICNDVFPHPVVWPPPFGWESPRATITNCIFSNNAATNHGGGIYNQFSAPIIRNSFFYSNSANLSGGGISNSAGRPTITNCTFFNNSAGEYGGGISNDARSIPTKVFNTILWGDTAGIDGPEIQEWVYNNQYWNNNIDQAGFDGWNGNIRQDPLFMDPSNGDLHLQEGSPSKDTGKNNAPFLADTDIDGEVRIVDATVDMGADEFLDTDGDGIPDYWEIRGGYDFDHDGIFDDVDADPMVFSNDFSDGTTSGTITHRSNQDLEISDVASPDGVRIRSWAGTTKATVSTCSGASVISINAGDEVIVTCETVIIKVITGSVDIQLIADDGTTSTASLGAGNTLAFVPADSTLWGLLRAIRILLLSWSMERNSLYLSARPSP